ncbi:MAG TPA: endonuclease [Pyrinomonadaceae bacterium]|jgi:endonuclease I/V8-like Glu-specific endopeptidase
MQFGENIIQGAAERWQQRQETRDANEEKLKEGGVVGVETPQRVKARLERLANNAVREQLRTAEANLASAGAVRSPSTTLLIERVGFERVMGKSDFLNMNFLELALAVSRFVGRINIKSSRTRTTGFGTGFMVSPRLLLTNNHVLPTMQEAIYSEAEFDYQYDRFGRLMPVVTYALEPQTFFITSADLDFTLVAVSERSVNNQVELKRYGWSRLIKEEGKALLGDSLNIIQHPRGEAKQIVLRSNRLVDLFDNFAHYETDTEPGSSGSPVYNDQWEIIALHHSGVPKIEDGNYIATDGSIWRPGMDESRLEWVANEGIRVSRLVDFIERQRLSPEQSELRRELLEKEPLHPLEAAAMADKPDPRPSPVPNVSSPENGEQSKNGVYTWTIPLQISVQLGIPQPFGQQDVLGGGASILSPSGGSQPKDNQNNAFVISGSGGQNTNGSTDAQPQADNTDLREALAELEQASNRQYYDKQADQARRDEYYRNIRIEGLDEGDFYRELNTLLEDTHTKKLSYQPSKHVYPWVDLHESGSQMKLKSVYSGREFDPREFIESDFRIEQERKRLREVLVRESTFTAVGAERQLDLLEASLPYNCEHVVPQSWFGKKEPMRGDLHHLFACESGCNSFRGNIPYFDFTDFEETIRESCGKREENRFEPSAGKGAVARATLYFLLRYPGEINRTSREYTEDRIKTLLDWHEKEKPSLYEKHRNAAIQEKQGNRNPLIDFPEWAARIDFIQGLG